MGSYLTIPSPQAEVHRGSSFAFSFSFLPKIQREALKSLYAFCRTTDDIVDNENDAVSNIERLKLWRGELEQSLSGSSAYPVLNQFSSVVQKFHIPVVHAYELLRGAEMDITKNRYETFEELKEYCYLVASTVGLMSLQIFGPKNERSKEYAINLGIALQLTNIVRDVAIDANYGRIYLPLDDLRRFHYTEHELLTKTYNQNFIDLMKYQTDRAEKFFAIARQSLPDEDKRPMFAAKIMERIYFHTLQRIKDANYNVFGETIHLSRTLQLMIAVKYWVKQRLFGA